MAEKASGGRKVSPRARAASPSGGYEKYVAGPLATAGLAAYCVYTLALLFDLFGAWTGFPALAALSDALSQGGLVMGAAVGAGVALGAGQSPVCVLSAAAAGAAGAACEGMLTAFLAGFACVLLCALVAGKTRGDVVIAPFVCGLCAALAAFLVAPYAEKLYGLLDKLVDSAASGGTLVMCALVGLIFGALSVTPLSVAALSALAVASPKMAGAAFAGVAAQMTAFACVSAGDNAPWAVLAQALGGARLQAGNVARRPAVWIAPLAASAASGLVSGLILFECPAACVPMGFTALNAFYVFAEDLGDAALLTAVKAVVAGAGVSALVAVPLGRLLRRAGLLRAGDLSLRV